MNGFDVHQVISAVRYGKIITEHPLACNELEYWVYFSNSMQIIINADIDLMTFSEFDKKEIGDFREYVLTLQKMARIGNWLTTWEREVEEGDLTSILIPRALHEGVISKENILSNSLEVIKKSIKQKSTKEKVLKEWKHLYEFAANKGENISSVNNATILCMFEYLLTMHLISENFK